MTDDVHDRLDRLESTVEGLRAALEDQRATVVRQEKTIETLVDRIAEPASPGPSGHDRLTVTRRDALKAGGLMALLGAGAGAASADPQGQVGDPTDPVYALYTSELNGPVTGDRAVTDLAGVGLTVTDGSLSIRTAWPLAATEKVKITAGNATGDASFGEGVALSGDRTTAIATAPHEDHSGLSGPGSAYLFDVADGWTQTTTLTASDAAGGDRFGNAVALSRDGTVGVIGASGDDHSGQTSAGSAYVFEVANGWTQTAKLTAGDAAGVDFFGNAVALSDDGITALVGARGDDHSGGADAGSAYVFDATNGWTQTAKLTAADAARADSFGGSVALSGDGTRAIVGATKNDPSGQTEAGTAYVFDATNGWAQATRLTANDAASADHFGSAVTLDGDGTTAVVTASNDDHSGLSGAGSAYVFEATNGWTQTTKLTANDAAGGDRFGSAVALSRDGATAVIGASGDEQSGQTAAGSAYVFEAANGWTQAAKLTASDAADDDAFGTAVDVSDDGFAVIGGAPLDDHTGLNNAGSAYAFEQELDLG